MPSWRPPWQWWRGARCGPLRGRRLGWARLSLHICATFLSFFRPTSPQLSRNFRKGFSHRPRCGSKGQVLSTSFWRGLQFSELFETKSCFCRMGPASWRAAAARFSKELVFLEPGNVKFCSPVHYCSPRLEPRPQLSSTFGLSPDHRNFRKNFRESLAQPNVWAARLCLCHENHGRPTISSYHV